MKPQEQSKSLVNEIQDSFTIAKQSKKATLQRKLKIKKMQMERSDRKVDDIVANILEKYDDPDFFGQPYIFVQLGHGVLLGTTLLALFFADSGLEFALFQFSGDALQALRVGTGLVLGINFALAIACYQEEAENGFVPAVIYALKALVLGGIATWYKLGVAQKKAQREEEEEILGEPLRKSLGGSDSVKLFPDKW